MTYATQSDIENELKGVTFTASSQVTASAVGDFLEQADAIIDMHLVKRYTTPITGSDSLLIVKKIAIDIVAYRITKILDLKKSVPIPDNNVIQNITEGSAYRESMKMLIAIRDNKMDLPDETELNAYSPLISFHTETGNNDIEPFFEKGVKQW